MLVRFMKQGPAYGYGLHIGEEVELPNNEALKLIEQGVVVALVEKKEIETAAMDVALEEHQVKRKRIVR